MYLTRAGCNVVSSLSFSSIFAFLLLFYLDARADREGPFHCARVSISFFFSLKELNEKGIVRGYKSHGLLE